VLSNFTDMSMTAAPGRTYRYYAGPAPLWDFGAGGSYATFALAWSGGAPPAISFSAPSDGVNVSVTVCRTGAFAGPADEVVQAYAVPLRAAIPGAPTFLPKRSLVAWQRVGVPAGGCAPVILPIPAEGFMLTTDAAQRQLLAGGYQLAVTNGVTAAPLVATVSVTGSVA
jgi:hypothetical protein